jgi:hypothetical protein
VGKMVLAGQFLDKEALNASAEPEQGQTKTSSFVCPNKD